MAHFSVKHRAPFKNSLMPSRRHCRHAAARYRATLSPPYTRRRLGGRHPLCGIGVTSRMAVISRPTAWSDRMAASRPAPGPRTNTSTCLSPRSMALRAAFSAAVWAAKGVLFREPLNPTLLALAPALAGCRGGLGFVLLCCLLDRFVCHALGSLLLWRRRGGGRRRHRLLLDHDALALALAGAGVGVGALPTHGQPLAVTDPAVAADVHEALHAHGDLAPQIALDLELALDDVANARRLLVGPGLDPLVGIHARIRHNFLGRGNADAVDVLDRDLAALVARQVDSGYACHEQCSSLNPGAVCGAGSCR